MQVCGRHRPRPDFHYFSAFLLLPWLRTGTQRALQHWACVEQSGEEARHESFPVVNNEERTAGYKHSGGLSFKSQTGRHVLLSILMQGFSKQGAGPHRGCVAKCICIRVTGRYLHCNFNCFTCILFWSQCYTVNKIKRKHFISYFISISYECVGMWRARGEGRCRDRGLEIHLSFTSASFLITIILTF